MNKTSNEAEPAVTEIEKNVEQSIEAFNQVYATLPISIKASPATLDLMRQSAYYQMHVAPLADTFMGLRIESDFDNKNGSVRICGK